MDASRDALFVGDSAGYVHVLRLALCSKGALQPLVQLERIPPAGENCTTGICLQQAKQRASLALRGHASREMASDGTCTMLCQCTLQETGWRASRV